jgi:hypothetical protein
LAPQTDSPRTAKFRREEVSVHGPVVTNVPSFNER